MVLDYLRAPAHNLRATIGDRACAATSNDKGLRRYLRAHARCPEFLSRASRQNAFLKTWCAKKYVKYPPHIYVRADLRAGARR